LIPQIDTNFENFHQFKQLMLSFDGQDADDEDEEQGGARPAAKVYTISQAAPEEPATSAQGPNGQVI
jgi:hypothetical protein